MNIWCIQAYDQPRGKSARTYDFSLELISLGHKVTFFTNSYCHWKHTDILQEGERWRIEEIDGIRVVWLKTFPYTDNGWRRGANMLSNARRSLQAAATIKEKPDVVIGPSVPLGTGWAASRIAKKAGAAFVFEVRDVWPIALVDDGGMSPNSPVYHVFRYLEKKLYSRAHRISSTLPFLFEHVKESGSNPAKVEWVPNGVNLDRFEKYKTYDGGKSEKLKVMYIGGFGVAHDVISLVRAAHMLNESNPGCFSFIIIGSGVKKKECVEFVNSVGISNIEFRDPIDKARIPEVQTEADVLVACVTDSASYRFGLNLNKLFDYFASARPVVFSGNAPNDPIEESQSGYSVHPERPDEIARVLLLISKLSPKERKQMGERGRSYLENNFDMKRLGKKMEKLLLDAKNAAQNKF